MYRFIIIFKYKNLKNHKIITNDSINIINIKLIKNKSVNSLYAYIAILKIVVPNLKMLPSVEFTSISCQQFTKHTGGIDIFFLVKKSIYRICMI